jgi:predicted DCC family thiol-disulfide oxidoreductase YuxK
MMASSTMPKQTGPVLLFDDECGVCRRIARWVQTSTQVRSGETSLVVRPIGADPEALRSLNPALDIWEAYATIHLLMPDGSMKVGGKAVAEVLRNLRSTRWLAWALSIRVFGLRPFQVLLDMAYVVLADVRPLFGCESCGMPRFWVRPLHWLLKRAKVLSGEARGQSPRPNFTGLSARVREP